MVNLTATQEVTETKKIELRKVIELTEGQTLKDDAELIALANKTVPTGKIAIISVCIRVDSINEV